MEIFIAFTLLVVFVYLDHKWIAKAGSRGT